MGQQLHAHSAIRRLLEHPSPHVRKKAVSILTAAEDLSVKHQMVAMIRDNDLDVRTEALRYLIRHDDMDPLNYIDRLGDFADFSIRSATIDRKSTRLNSSHANISYAVICLKRKKAPAHRGRH